MALPVFQPVPQFNFTVTMWDAPASNDAGSILTSVASAAINVVTQFLFGAFSEIQGLNADIEIETYQEGGRNTKPRRFFKHAKYQNLVLKHGVTSSTAIWDWYEQIRTGVKKVRKNGMIILYDRGGPGLVGAGLPGLDRIPTAAWIFDNALPERVQGPTLNAKSNEIAIETLEMSHEQLQRLSLSMIPGFSDINSALGGVAGAGASAALGATAALA